MNTKWTLAEPEAVTPQNTKERRVASQHLLKWIYNNMHTNEPETPLSFCIHYSLFRFIGKAAVQWNDYREHRWEWDDNSEEIGAASVPSPRSPCMKITMALEKEKVAGRETRWEAQDVSEGFFISPLQSTGWLSLKEQEGTEIKRNTVQEPVLSLICLNMFFGIDIFFWKQKLLKIKRLYIRETI